MFPSDDEPYVVEDEEELEEIRREAEQRRQRRQRDEQQQQQQQRRQRPPQIQPPQLNNPFGGFGLGGLMQQAMNAGFGGHLGQMARASAAMFRQDYQAFSTVIHETSEGRMDRINGGRQNLMFGGSS